MRLLPFDYAVRNLGRSRLRLALLVAGSALVVGLVVTAAGFVRGMSAALRASGSPHNVILLGAGSEESIERSEIPAATPALLDATLYGIRRSAGVAHLSPEVQVMLPVEPGAVVDAGAPRGTTVRGGRQAVIRGVTPGAFLVHEEVRLVEGRLPRNGEDELLAGRMAGAGAGLPAAALAIGNSVTVDGRPWTIVGRFAAPGTVSEGEFWTSLPALMASTRRDTISCVVMTLDPAEAEFADVAAFTKMRPDLELVALREAEYYGAMEAFFAPIRAVAWITAALIGLAGLFGGLNTLHAAFASRSRELGMLQALGYRRGAVLLTLVQESLVAALAGTLIAVAVGAFLLDGLAVRLSTGTFGLVVDPSVVGAGLLCGFVLGVAGALYPALHALRQTIPVALKTS